MLIYATNKKSKIDKNISGRQMANN